MDIKHTDIGLRKSRSPMLRVSTVIDELIIIADYLNVARRAEEGDDLDSGSARGTSRLLFDCHQRLVALQDDLFFISRCLERNPSDVVYPPLVEQGNVHQETGQGIPTITGYIAAAAALVTALLCIAC